MRNFITKTVKGNEAQLSGKALAARLVLLVLVLGVILTGIIGMSSSKKDKYNFALPELTALDIFPNLRGADPSKAYKFQYGQAVRMPGFDEYLYGFDNIKYFKSYNNVNGTVKIDTSVYTEFQNYNIGDESSQNPKHYFVGWYSPSLGRLFDFSNDIPLEHISGSMGGGLIGMWEFRPEFTLKVHYNGVVADEVKKVVADKNSDEIVTFDDKTITKEKNGVTKEYTLEGYYSSSDFAEETKVTSMAVNSIFNHSEYAVNIFKEGDRNIESYNVNTTPTGVEKNTSTIIDLYANWTVKIVNNTSGSTDNGNNGGNGGSTDNNANGGNAGKDDNNNKDNQDSKDKDNSKNSEKSSSKNNPKHVEKNSSQTSDAQGNQVYTVVTKKGQTITTFVKFDKSKIASVLSSGKVNGTGTFGNGANSFNGKLAPKTDSTLHEDNENSKNLVTGIIFGLALTVLFGSVAGTLVIRGRKRVK